MNDKESYQNTAKNASVGLSIFNTSILYSTFIMPIYKAQFAAVFANPLFMIPSLLLNYLLYQRYYVFFYGDRSQITNMFLMPNGKQLIVETRDKDMREVNITDIYDAIIVDSRYEQRIDFGHGANNYLFIRGNSIIYDSWVLSQVLENRYINTKNVAFSFDVTKDEFTWEFKDLVEIKKRKRIVNRIIKPTALNLSRAQLTRQHIKAKQQGIIPDKTEPHPNYFLYEFMPDKHMEDKDKAAKQKEQYERNLTNGGLLESTKKTQTQKTEREGGRRVKKIALA